MRVCVRACARMRLNCSPADGEDWKLTGIYAHQNPLRTVGGFTLRFLQCLCSHSIIVRPCIRCKTYSLVPTRVKLEAKKVYEFIVLLLVRRYTTDVSDWCSFDQSELSMPSRNICGGKPVPVSNLVLYAKSTITVIPGRGRPFQT